MAPCRKGAGRAADITTRRMVRSVRRHMVRRTIMDDEPGLTMFVIEDNECVEKVMLGFYDQFIGAQ